MYSTQHMIQSGFGPMLPCWINKSFIFVVILGRKGPNVFADVTYGTILTYYLINIDTSGVHNQHIQ